VDKTQLAELAHRFVSGTATEEEKALLHQWFDSADKDEVEEVFLPERATEDDVRTRIKSRLLAAINEETQDPPQDKSRPIGMYIRWMAAAAAIIAISLTGLYLWKNNKTQHPPVAAAPINHNDLLPGGNKATLTLGDGSVVNLAAAKNGIIQKLAGTLIAKQDSQLRYNVAAANPAVEMNTIRTPRGGQYQVVLPDGTKVWLNAASSLTYPTAFTGEDRTVKLNGEAYFEVAANAGKPFRVMVGNMQVNVLGTHFNVMAYEDEGEIRTTLLEGSVRVANKTTSHLLKPGQAARLDRSSETFRLLDVDPSESVAWKNGVFQFGGVSIETVMREIVRWYDVDVEYQGRPNEHFRGTISRSANASEVFKMLELTGAVHFTIDKKKIIVKP